MDRMKDITLICGDARTELKKFPEEFFNCCITSPPYWGLRNYGVDGQLGQEPSPSQYVYNLSTICLEIYRVLKNDGIFWLNLGDSSCGSSGQTGGLGINTYQKEAGATDKPMKPHKIIGYKPKDLVGIPWTTAIAQRSGFFDCGSCKSRSLAHMRLMSGLLVCQWCGAPNAISTPIYGAWYLRMDNVWHKLNPMPDAAKDRCTRGHEFFFHLTKRPKYSYNYEAVKEPATTPNKSSEGNGYRNRRSVWTFATKPFAEAHFATYPEELIKPLILASSPIGGNVLDPFNGAGTTGLVATRLGRKYWGIDLKQEYIDMTIRRIKKENQ